MRELSLEAAVVRSWMTKHFPMAYVLQPPLSVAVQHSALSPKNKAQVEMHKYTGLHTPPETFISTRKIRLFSAILIVSTCSPGLLPP